MSTPLSAADPKRLFAYHSARDRFEKDLQSKRIKEVILPILAVLGSFFLFSLDSAILFTAIVVFGVFICGDRRCINPLPRARFPFSNPPNIDGPNLWRDIPSPVKPSGKKTPQLHPATPVGGTSTFRPTPGTMQRVAHWLGMPEVEVAPLVHSIEVSPQTFARSVSQMKPSLSVNDPSLEIKQTRTPDKESERTPRHNTRNSALGTPRNLAAEFGSQGHHLPSVHESDADEL